MAPPGPAPPDGFTLLAAPCSHSRKPYLGDLLRPYLADMGAARGGGCLEMFAREMRAGWDSWGNEVLCFQELRQFCP